MFNKSQILLSLIFLMACSAASAQSQIERLFRSDRQMTAIDVAQTSDKGYLILSGARPLDSLRFEYLNVTKVDDKSNLLWSKDYSFEHKIFPDGSLTLLNDDEFVISGLLDTSSINKILMKADAGGNVLWSQGFGRDDVQAALVLGDAAVDISFRNGFYLAGDVYNSILSTDIFLAEADEAGSQLWAKSYSENSNEFLTAKVRMAQDSGAIVCGTVFNLTKSNIFVVKTDTAGVIEWSREYGESSLVEIGTAIAPTPDGGYLIGGRKINPLLPSHPGLLIKTDTFGTPQWTMNVDFQTSDSILINDIIIDSGGDAVVSGSLLGAADNLAFMMKVQMDGDITWKKIYKTSTRQFTSSNGLIESPEGGYVYITNSDDEMTNMQVGPYLIKTEDDGTTLCDSTFDGQLLYPTTVTLDTLILTETDITDTVDITVVDTLNYFGLQLEVLSLETFGPYCPDAVFNDTLDATTEGAVSYEWSTGETTPTIVVSEFDEYKVTVTIGVDYCYILCATTTISELPLPMVELSINDDTFCSTGIVTINAAPMAVDNIEWSSGEMQTNSIQVDTEGLYSVTVSNTCDTITAEIDVVFDTTGPEASIDPLGDFCANGTVDLVASSVPEGDGFVWSTGDETNSITADELNSTYIVTVTSNFCEDGTAEYTVTPVDVIAAINGDATFCNIGSEVLTASGGNTYIWSTGANTEQITITAQGTYSVTVTDFCDTDSTSAEVLCPITYDIGNAFTPNNDEISELFIPVFDFDPTELIEYEFIIYSRWGEKVFETNNPLEGWDGMVGDSPGISDVYIFTIKGVNNLGVELSRSELSDTRENHGDVTLIR